jgi:hypothetical protein
VKLFPYDDCRLGEIRDNVHKISSIDFRYAIRVGEHDFCLTDIVALDGETPATSVTCRKDEAEMAL